MDTRAYAWVCILSRHDVICPQASFKFLSSSWWHFPFVRVPCHDLCKRSWEHTWTVLYHTVLYRTYVCVCPHVCPRCNVAFPCTHWTEEFLQQKHVYAAPSHYNVLMGICCTTDCARTSRSTHRHKCTCASVRVYVCFVPILLNFCQLVYFPCNFFWHISLVHMPHSLHLHLPHFLKKYFGLAPCAFLTLRRKSPSSPAAGWLKAG